MKQTMVRLWITAIISKKKSFQEVPKGLKEAVKENLIAAGRQDLLME